jgi:hypothetical protein
MKKQDAFSDPMFHKHETRAYKRMFADKQINSTNFQKHFF